MTPLCALEDIRPRGARGFDPTGAGRDTLFVVRQGHQVHGYRDACPHLGTPMAWRKDAYLDAAGQHIVCSAHGALFEIDTGLCTLGPCVGEVLEAVPLVITAGGSIALKETE
jgi:nitrite reductase/ring-hydroxylating ferredoxin subunit